MKQRLTYFKFNFIFSLLCVGVLGIAGGGCATLRVVARLILLPLISQSILSSEPEEEGPPAPSDSSDEN